MSKEQIENLYEKYICSLQPNEQLKLVEIIVNKLSNNVGNSNVSLDKLSNWEKSMEWLKLNKKNYIDQWVALNGNNLLAVGKEAKEVYESAKKQGITAPFLTRVEKEIKDEYYFGGWQ